MPSALLSILFSIVLVSTVNSQVTSNTTCSSTWKSLYNSKGQSPCLVAAYLGSVCNGGQYDVSALNEGSHYIGPTSATANACQCSTVYYSLIGGCSICQNASVITWSSWAEDCSEVWVDVFSETIPSDTVVPGWAYENVTTSGTFNATEAASDDSPESTASGSQTTQTGGSSTSSASASAAPAADSSSSGSSSHTGAIVGGVVGGVVGAALLALIAFLLLRRRNKKPKFTPGPASPTGEAKADLTGTTYTDGPSGNGYQPVPYTPGAYDQGGVGMPQPQHSQKLYDPNDPSTFPPSLNQELTGDTYGSGTGMGSNGYQGSNAATQGAHSGVTGPNAGAYHGYAEV